MITWNTDADMTPAQAHAEHARQDVITWAVRDALLATPGLTNTELFERFGPSAVKRLNDLKRQHGYDYAREHVAGHVWRYRLTGVPGRAPLHVDRVVLVPPTNVPAGRLC